MPMTPPPAKRPPDHAAANESLVPAMLRVSREGVLIGIEDHLGNNLGLPVTTQSSGEVLRFLAGDLDPRIFQAGPVAFQPQGKAAISATAGANRHLAAVMPFRWFGVQAKVFNAHGSATPTYNVGIATADNITDSSLNAETWETFKWGGSQNVIPPVASNSTPGNQTMGESGWSDPIIGAPKAYGNGTVMGLRSWADSANNTWFDFDPEGALSCELNAQGIYVAWKSSVGNAVLTPSLFTSPVRTQAAAPPVLLRFLTPSMVRVHLTSGSSTTGGKGDTADMGWAARTQRVLNALGGMAYQFCNYSHGGAPTAGNDLRMQQVVDDVNPHTMTSNGFTLNDPDYATADGLARLKARIDWLIAFKKNRGLPPKCRIFQTWQHRTGATGGEYSNAKAINAYLREKAAAGECVLFDVAAVLSDETASVGTWKDPADTTDGTHPNSQGHAKLVPYALAIYG